MYVVWNWSWSHIMKYRGVIIKELAFSLSNKCFWILLNPLNPCSPYINRLTFVKQMENSFTNTGSHMLGYMGIIFSASRQRCLSREVKLRPTDIQATQRRGLWDWTRCIYILKIRHNMELYHCDTGFILGNISIHLLLIIYDQRRDGATSSFEGKEQGQRLLKLRALITRCEEI